jgi:hypothetical protein
MPREKRKGILLDCLKAIQVPCAVKVAGDTSSGSIVIRWAQDLLYLHQLLNYPSPLIKYYPEIFYRHLHEIFSNNTVHKKKAIRPHTSAYNDNRKKEGR